MANRMFNQPKGSLEKGVCTLFCAIPLGASGALAASGTGGVGIASVIKTVGKTGRYTITLQDAYKKFLGGIVTFVGSADAAPANGKAVGGYFRNQSVSTAAGGTIEVQMYHANGTANVDAEADDSTTILVELRLGDSLV
jgi:hypothetical protein